MSKLEVIKVSTRSHKRRFLRLPEAIHENDPNFVPRIRANESELAGFFFHPFYETADSQAFMVVSQGVRQGRVLAIDDKGHRRRFPDDQCGFVGFFECSNDKEVARLLFQSVEEWFESKKIKQIKGPIHPSSNYEAGLLVNGFEQPACFMTPYNPDYYDDLWKQSGFKKDKELAVFSGDKRLFESNTKAWQLARSAVEKFGVQIQPLDRKSFVQQIESYYSLYNETLQHTPGFVPLSKPEIEFDAKELRHLIVPELSAFMTHNHKTIGAGIALLDYNPLIKQIKGRLFPFGFLTLLFGRRKIRKVRLMTPCLKPKYRGTGLGLSLVNFLMRQATDYGVNAFEFPLLDTDKSSARALGKLGLQRQRLYRLYEKTVA